jgi:hypothetical protein
MFKEPDELIQKFYEKINKGNQKITEKNKNEGLAYNKR